MKPKNFCILLGILLLIFMALTAHLWIQNGQREKALDNALSRIILHIREHLSQAQNLLIAVTESNDVKAIDLAIIDIITAKRMINVLADLDQKYQGEWTQISAGLGAEVYRTLHEVGLNFHSRGRLEAGELKTLEKVNELLDIITSLFPEGGKGAWANLERSNLEKAVQAMEQYRENYYIADE